ncbi:TetR/AcrR family transcriptional regulator [Actinomadura soli]|uniref:TetR/AcrR family transcriptional regulator n=1 Tax=Actinomadura soli TaxID=2508997 RepID=A0A5C4JD87_9ACTN|nr:TetR/AcrR family transcriptional regulator [Actinomadura soli]TMR00536.1 TetR/AcrR family transcriptional regulator [Actinomadura soli]
MSSLERICQVAVRLFAERGYAATGIRDIGRAAGLNPATLYHYAGGKEELLVDIMRTGLEELLRVGREAVAHSADPAVQLARLVLAHVATEALNPLTSRVVDREVQSLTGGNRTKIMNLRDDYESLVERALERGARTGAFEITDVRIVRLALLEMCNGVAIWYRGDGRLSVAELQDRFVELACRMVGARLISREEYGPQLTTVRLASEPPSEDLSGAASQG